MFKRWLLQFKVGGVYFCTSKFNIPVYLPARNIKASARILIASYCSYCLVAADQYCDLVVEATSPKGSNSSHCNFRTKVIIVSYCIEDPGPNLKSLIFWGSYCLCSKCKCLILKIIYLYLWLVAYWDCGIL